MRKLAILLFAMALGASVGTAAADDRLAPDERLQRGQQISSNDGRFRLILQQDGNLVLYGPADRVRWTSGTHGQGAAVAVMQSDGNLVLYRDDGRPVWASGTDGRNGAWLVLQDDGNLVMYWTPPPVSVWSSNTPE